MYIVSVHTSLSKYDYPGFLSNLTVCKSNNYLIPLKYWSWKRCRVKLEQHTNQQNN